MIIRFEIEPACPVFDATVIKVPPVECSVAAELSPGIGDEVSCVSEEFVIARRNRDVRIPGRDSQRRGKTVERVVHDEIDGGVVLKYDSDCRLVCSRLDRSASAARVVIETVLKVQVPDRFTAPDQRLPCSVA